MSLSIITRFKRAALGLLGRRLSKCREITPIIGESLDRKLTLREVLSMRLHLITCRACRNYLSNIKFIREVFEQDESPTDLSASLTDEARERMKKSLEESA